jgi:tetratricopeptide (TPR) repeat protein
MAPPEQQPRERTPCAHLKSLWDFAKPEESERRFIAAARASAAGNDTACELEALTQAARAQGLQRRFDEAHKTLDEVDARLRGAPAGRVALRSKLERGRVFNSSKQQEPAYALFVAAWELARALGEDGLAVDAAHMVAIAKIKEPEAALEWNLKALGLAQASAAEDARAWLGSLYNNIGWTYFDRGDYAQALQVFEQGVAFRAQQRGLKPLLIAKWCVARTFRALGRTKEALAAQRTLQTEYEQNGMPPDGYLYEELAELHLELGQPGHQQLFDLAHAALSKDPWFVESERERLERMFRLSRQ